MAVTYRVVHVRCGERKTDVHEKRRKKKKQKKTKWRRFRKDTKCLFTFAYLDRIHTMTGVGTPWAWQCKAIWRLRSTLTSTGSTIHLGGTRYVRVHVFSLYLFDYFVGIRCINKVKRVPEFARARHNFLMHFAAIQSHGYAFGDRSFIRSTRVFHFYCGNVIVQLFCVVMKFYCGLRSPWSLLVK